jgi:hypothetical protein
VSPCMRDVRLGHQRITVAEQATEMDGHFTWGPPKTEAGENDDGPTYRRRLPAWPEGEARPR